MDVSLLIRHRLKDLGLEQKDLAAAAQVTESYISQLLARKKAPPAPGRTDIYEKIGKVLKLPSGELSHLADLQRKEELRKKVAETPRPLFKECRELILRKCDSGRQKEVRRIFEKEPFGELERLVTQKLLDVAQGVAKEELQSGEWFRLMAQLSGRSYEQVRVAILEFLDTDVFNVSVENCVSFLDPIIDSWDIDLKTFGMAVVPDRLGDRAGDEVVKLAGMRYGILPSDSLHRHRAARRDETVCPVAPPGLAVIAGFGGGSGHRQINRSALGRVGGVDRANDRFCPCFMRKERSKLRFLLSVVGDARDIAIAKGAGDSDLGFAAMVRRKQFCILAIGRILQAP